MAACFSSSNTFAAPFVIVLSQIPRLTECLRRYALPGIQVKQLELPADNNGKDLMLQAEHLDHLKNTEIVVCDSDLLGKTYKHMPNLKWAHCTWAGIESLSKAIIEEPSFLLTRHGGENFSTLMAEYVICQILNCERRFRLCWEGQKSREWIKSDAFTSCRSLDELTVGILGAGNMASGIAKFLKTRGSTVLGFARTPRFRYDQNEFDRITVNLNEVLQDCDYLCNTLPSTPVTCGMLNNSILRNCMKKPVFINVGRGNIISESELVQAISNKWLLGAVLDVFEEEPLPASSMLWDMPEVIITPHIAALSKPEHIAEEFFTSFSQYIDGHEIQNVVNWKAGY